MNREIGFAKPHIRLTSLNIFVMKFFFVNNAISVINYRTTFGIISELIKPNRTLSRKLKN